MPQGTERSEVMLKRFPRQARNGLESAPGYNFNYFTQADCRNSSAMMNDQENTLMWTSSFTFASLKFWIETKSTEDLSATSAPQIPVNPREDVLLHEVDERRKKLGQAGNQK